MCQLTLTYTKYVNLERILVTLLSIRNSKTNQHGWGLLNRAGMVWKVAQSANLTTNAGICVRAMVSTAPNIIHVRAASKGVEVSEVNVHPFEFKNLVGIHNGTLWYKDETVTYTSEASRPSDSSRFLSMLNDMLETEKNFCTAIAEVMKDWRGKFAFMILDKRDGVRYVIRGKSATLYLTNLKDSKGADLGYVVNTELDSLNDTLPIANQIFQLESGSDFTYSVPTLLKEETIWRVEPKGLVEVGKLNENPLYSAYPRVTQPAIPTMTPSTSSGSDMPTRGTGRSLKAPDALINEVFRFMEDEALIITDMETIWHAVFGHGLLAATPEEIETFCSEVIQRLKSSGAVRKFIHDHYLYRIDLDFWNDNPQLIYPLGMQQNGKAAVLTALRRSLSA